MLRARVLIAALLATAAAAACTAPVVPPGGGGGGRGGGGGTAAPTIAGCPVFPADNAWNQDVSGLPVSARSANYVASINASGTKLHPDFGGGGAYGIPFLVVPGTEAKRTINYTAYGDESDPGPFPIPPTAPVEGGTDPNGDRHVVVVQRDSCHLYELGRAFWKGDHWDATVGVNWDLRSNALRPYEWTSADAAGLPILPGLVRYDEVAVGLGEPRAPLHRVALATRVHPAGNALRIVEHGPEPAADGLAVALARRFRHLALHGRVARDPRGTEEVRDDRRRQRLVVVHHGRGRPPVERRRPEPAQDRSGQRVRRRRHRTGPLLTPGTIRFPERSE